MSVVLHSYMCIGQMIKNFDSQDVEFTLKENGDVEWKFPDNQVNLKTASASELHKIVLQLPKNSPMVICILSRSDFLSLTVTPLKFFVRGTASLLLFFSGEAQTS